MEWKNAITTLGTAAASATLMYLLDPQQGRRRRALVRDKAVHAGKATSDAADVVARDFRHRARGAFAAGRSRLRSEGQISPRRLEARARSILGRVVSHPRAISIHANDDGTLIVSGYILPDEVQPLLNALNMVPGVHGIDNRLEPGEHPESMPSLQGGRRRPGLMPDMLQRRMSPTSRVIAGAGSVALAAYGLGRRDALGGVLTALGAITGTRAATNMDLRRMVGLGGGREAVRIQNSIEVNAPVEEVFNFFSHFENFPRFMQHIRQVHKTENDIWHWEADGPLGSTVSWDAVVTRMEPNRRISWKSIAGSMIGNTGSVWFDRIGDNRTRVHIQMSYNPPAGALGHAISSLLGADPVRQMDADLIRFQSIIERGKTSARGEQVTREQITAH